MIIADSRCITIDEDELSGHENYFNGWSESFAQMAVVLALTKEGDERADDILFTKYSHTQLVENVSWSEVCYLEAPEVGYFFVMRDMVDHINVIFNRWD